MNLFTRQGRGDALRQIGNTRLPDQVQWMGAPVRKASAGLNNLYNSNNPVLDVPLSIGAGAMQGVSGNLLPNPREARTMAGGVAANASAKVVNAAQMALLLSKLPKLPTKQPPMKINDTIRGTQRDFTSGRETIPSVLRNLFKRK